MRCLNYSLLPLALLGSSCMSWQAMAEAAAQAEEATQDFDTVLELTAPMTGGLPVAKWAVTGVAFLYFYMAKQGAKK